MKKSFIKLTTLLLCIFIIFNLTSTNQIPSNDQPTPLLTSLKKCYSKSDTALRIMSYNLLADTPGFDGAPAYSRADGVCAILNTLKPDVIALQETSRNWFYALNKGTPYKFISPVKTRLSGTMTTLLYNPEALVLNHWGEYTFTKNHNGRLRCAVWGFFTERSTAKKFIVISTHLSLSDKENQFPEQQAMELINLINTLTNKYKCPLILTGDFNSDKRTSTNQKSTVYEILSTRLTDSVATSTEKSCGKSKDFSGYRVDHIFLSTEPKALRFVILSQPEFAALSDHYPIFMDLVL